VIPKPIRTLLLVEDNPGDVRLLLEMFADDRAGTPRVIHVGSMHEAESRLAASPVDVILLDLGLPDAQGLAAVRRAHAAAPRTALVVLTGLNDEAIAVQAMQEGAQDYLIKGEIEMQGLPRALRYALGRKQLEETLFDEKERAQVTLNCIGDGVASTDMAGNITFMNPLAVTMTGWSSEEAAGLPWQEILRLRGASGGEIPPSLRATPGQDASTRAPTSCLLQRRDDSEIPIEITVAPIHDRAGLPSGGVFVLRDVSEVRAMALEVRRSLAESLETQRELTAARNQLHRLVSESPAVLYAMRVDSGGIELAWISENIEQFAGYSLTEARAPEWWQDQLHPDESEAVITEMAAGLPAGRLVQEYRFRHRDGTYLWLRDEKRVLRDAAGEPTEIVGSWSDITVRKGAERRLSESEEEYRLLFDSNPHPMWVFDADTLAFLAVNEAAVRLYGFSRREFLAMTILEIRPPEESQALIAHVSAMSDHASQTAIHVRHRKKDGSLIEVAGATNPIEFHGRRAHLVLADDVSEQRRLEAQLQQVQRMEAVGRLAGGIAHDFNNLLGVITGYSELLHGELGAGHAGSKRLEQIQKAAERAAELTRQLLAFSRRQILQPRLVALDEIVADVEKMLHRVLGDDIELVTKRGSGPWLVLADPGQIGQVLANLVVNARDAMPNGGQLMVSTANVTLDEAYALAHPEVRAGDYVMLSVRDFGEGMDAATQAHMFEPFFTTKAAGKGTGLGLSTVFGIVEQSGGSLGVTSAPGLGTTVRIYLPRAAGVRPQASEIGLAAPLPKGAECVLLVEDADALREMIREILETAGYAVLECSDALAALSTAKESREEIALVLTDVVMPRMNGPDLVAKLRTTSPALRALFMSGFTGDVVTPGGLSAGNSFLQKPFTGDTLVRMVRAALDGPENGAGLHLPDRLAVTLESRPARPSDETN
jgi:PAS domain S-box-containing protein